MIAAGTWSCDGLEPSESLGGAAAPSSPSGGGRPNRRRVDWMPPPSSRSPDSNPLDVVLDAAVGSGTTEAGGPAGDAGDRLDAGPDASCTGLALQLDGDAHVVMPRLVQDDFTLEAWVRTTASLQGTEHYQGRGLIDADVNGVRDDFATEILNDRFVFGVSNDTLSGTSVVTTGEWIHVAATRRVDTGEMQVFVAGRLEASRVSANRASLADSASIALGGFASARHFIGEIDEVRLWNVVRTPEQIAASLRERLTGLEEGLVAYFNFDDGGVPATLDSSSEVAATWVGGAAYAPVAAPCPAP